jgi:hypothetical protein
VTRRGGRPCQGYGLKARKPGREMLETAGGYDEDDKINLEEVHMERLSRL